MVPITVPIPNDEFLTLREAAATTRVSVKWLRGEIKLGHLTAFRLGHKILVKRHGLEAFIAKRAMAPVIEEGR